jgi:DNA-binding NtrC family response regulator
VIDKDSLEGKRILIVDDEADVLDTLEMLLSMCEVIKATTFEGAKKLFETENFDLAILDIMGVRGYDLLEIAKKKKVPAIMLTAHEETPENVARSYKGGAASFVPKEEMSNIVVFLDDVVEALKRGKSPWWRWVDRFADHFDRKFGPEWQKKHRMIIK